MCLCVCVCVCVCHTQVRSRTFSEEVNGEGITLMVPWADLANHSCDYNSTFGLSKDKEWYACWE